MTFPYTQNPGNLLSVIEKISDHGIPEKFTLKELGVWGYTSSNDRRIIGVLKYIRFIDDKGLPTDLWKKARTQTKMAVGEGVRAGYADLYKTFPNAHNRDNEALINYFKGNTDVGDAAVKRMASTFKSLAEFGSFANEKGDSTASDATTESSSSASDNSIPAQPNEQVVTDSMSPAVNINIELQLPADPTGEVYDKFFAAMKKYLYNEKD